MTLFENMCLIKKLFEKSVSGSFLKILGRLFEGIPTVVTEVIQERFSESISGKISEGFAGMIYERNFVP